MFYELLRARRLFAAKNEFERLSAVLENDMQPIAAHGPQVAIWGPFFERALAKNPNERFRSADEMAQAIATLGRTLFAQPPSAVGGEWPQPSMPRLSQLPAQPQPEVPVGTSWFPTQNDVMPASPSASPPNPANTHGPGPTAEVKPSRNTAPTHMAPSPKRRRPHR